LSSGGEFNHTFSQTALLKSRNPCKKRVATSSLLDELRPIDPAKVQTAKFDDFVDRRAVRELQQEGFFK
jgi:hypothetical protein